MKERKMELEEHSGEVRKMEDCQGGEGERGDGE